MIGGVSFMAGEFTPADAATPQPRVNLNQLKLPACFRPAVLSKKIRTTCFPEESETLLLLTVIQFADFPPAGMLILPVTLLPSTSTWNAAPLPTGWNLP